jgi:hypothetical protein
MSFSPVRMALVMIACAGSSLSAQQTPLKLDLPKPLFIGTPHPIDIPNLEPLRKGGTPPVFMVPAGTALLSHGKKVTSSDDSPVIGDLTFITDGAKKGTDGTYVELGPGVQWVQIDLGAPASIAAIVLWHYIAEARVYHGVVVRVADDAAFTKNVRTLYNDDYGNVDKLGVGTDRPYIETNEGRIVDGKGQVARYVRCYSNGNTSDELNHYVEVEVYGSAR